jgi:hypothetical protein
MILKARGMDAEVAPRANQQSDDLDLPGCSQLLMTGTHTIRAKARVFVTISFLLCVRS